MGLFNKEKDLILKLTNLFLLLWLIASIAVLYVNIVDVMMPRPDVNYEKYKAANCIYGESLDEEICKEQYNSFKELNNSDYYNEKKIIFTSIGSVIIVSIALYSLNRKGKRK